jgi:hypothetical protein
VRGALEALVPERYAEMRNLLPPAQAARAAAVLLPGCFWYAVHRAHTAGEVPNECAGNPLDWWLSGGADRFAAVSAEGPAALPWPE